MAHDNDENHLYREGHSPNLEDDDELVEFRLAPVAGKSRAELEFEQNGPIEPPAPDPWKREVDWRALAQFGIGELMLLTAAFAVGIGLANILPAGVSLGISAATLFFGGCLTILWEVEGKASRLVWVCLIMLCLGSFVAWLAK